MIMQSSDLGTKTIIMSKDDNDEVLWCNLLCQTSYHDCGPILTTEVTR